MWWCTLRQLIPGRGALRPSTGFGLDCRNEVLVQGAVPVKSRSAFGLTEAELNWLQTGVRQAQRRCSDVRSVHCIMQQMHSPLLTSVW